MDYCMNFKIKEHLKVFGKKAPSWLIPYMHDRLAFLGALMLQDNAWFLELTLKIDGREFSFCGRDISLEYQELLRELIEATSVDLVTEYDYVYARDLRMLAPFAICKKLQKLKPAERLGFFYSAYIQAEEDDVGTLWAYGEKNNTLHWGKVASQKTDLPKDGLWLAPSVTIGYEEKNLKSKDAKRILAVCEQLCDFGEDEILNVTDNYLLFGLNNLLLQAKDFEVFVRLTAELIALSEDSCDIFAAFVEYSRPEARIVKIDFNNKGEYTVTMTAV